jgi:hypothetical protein
MDATNVATPSSWDEVFAPDTTAVDSPDGDAAEPGVTDSQADDAAETPSKPSADVSAVSQAEVEDQPSNDELPAAPDKNAPSQPEESKPQKDETRPFAYRVDRQDVAIPDAVETHNGWIAMPRKAWDQHVQPNLRDPAAYKRERSDFQRQIAELSPDRNAEVQFGRAIAGEIKKLQAGGLDAVVEWAENFLTNLPVLEANARASAAESKLKHHDTQRSESETNEAIARLATELPARLQTEVAEMLKRPEFQGLGLDAKELTSDLWEVRHSIFYEAPEGTPEYEQNGGIGLKTDPIYRLLKRTADVAKRTRDNALEATKVKKQNAVAVGAAAPVETPPAVSTRNSPAPAGRQEKAPANLREWLDS